MVRTIETIPLVGHIDHIGPRPSKCFHSKFHLSLVLFFLPAVIVPASYKLNAKVIEKTSNTFGQTIRHYHTIKERKRGKRTNEEHETRATHTREAELRSGQCLRYCWDKISTNKHMRVCCVII